MRASLLLLSVVVVACGTPTPSTDAGLDASVPFSPTQTRVLGLNDVTFLFPLESADAGTPFPAAVELIPFAAFDRLTTATPAVNTDLLRLRVVALRFDICDRALPVPCAEDADGVFRFVLQPVFGTPVRVEDVAFHAFFSVPRADVPRVVDELRALAALQDVPVGAALQVNTAFATNPEYRRRLGALVTPYAKAARLHRVTLFGQETERAALIWIFRGEERNAAGVLARIEVPGIGIDQQEVSLFGGDSYLVNPVADVPAGFARAMMEVSFRNATAAEQLESVKSLAIVDNPEQHTANTVQCVSCHVSTTVLPPRAADAGVDLWTLNEWFKADPFSDGLLGEQSTRTRTLRALGYVGSTPLTTMRVINETVNVLKELEQRYPPAAP